MVEIDITLTITPTIDFGSPRANIGWSRDGQILATSDPRVTISSDGVLTVSSVNKSDEGLYTIVVSNTYGASNDSVAVTIECESVCLASRDTRSCMRNASGPWLLQVYHEECSNVLRDMHEEKNLINIQYVSAWDQFHGYPCYGWLGLRWCLSSFLVVYRAI
jgi:hypothetical protein